MTEVHLHCHREEQLRWFRYIWNACKKVKKEGVDIMGVTAWAMLGSYGWNKLLTKPKGEYEPGVFDLRAPKPRPTALATFIKEIASQQECYHPVSEEKGWWERDNRFLHDPIIRKAQKSPIKSNKEQPILIIGKHGTLGQAFGKVCGQRFIHHKTVGRQNCDIAELKNIESVIYFYKPWAIINAAGYVRVDDAEKEEELCYRENTFGAYNLSVACKHHGIKLVTFSTDLVFDGNKPTAYIESDPVNPLNVYGRSKSEAEQLILQHDPSSLIIRTSAFFGPWDEYNFLHWVIKNLSDQQEIPVASDVQISPTYVPDLVHATLDLLIDDENNIWHIANKGAITWADLAKEAAKQFDLDFDLINAKPVSDMHLPAQRPKNSTLSSENGIFLPTLNNALQRFFDEKREEIYT
jgi:dTDP-4-dehydrorhamnose reductase